MRWICLVLLAGCFGGETIEHRTATTGRVCLYSNEPHGPAAQHTFLANQPVHVEFVADECLPGCTRDVAADVALAPRNNGTGFEIDGYAEWTEVSGPGLACPAVCVVAGATTVTSGLPNGSYTFHFGGAQIALTVPSQPAEPPCVDSP